MIIGGGSRGGIILTSNVTLYDAAKKSWIKVDLLTSARDCVGVAMLNDNAVIIIGGTRGGENVELRSSSIFPHYSRDRKYCS